MTKKIDKSGEDIVLAEFKPKKQNIDVIFPDDYSYTDDKATPHVVTFLDIKGYSLNGPYLIIQEKDDTQHVYPMDKINSLKLYITE